MSCNASLSQFCVENPDRSDLCFPASFNRWDYVYGLWALFHGLLCTVGNLWTLLVIPYAALRQRFNPHQGWIVHAFLLNLALADLLHCALSIPWVALTYMKQGWFWG